MQSVEHMVHAKWIISAVSGEKTLENHSLVINNGIIKDILPTSAAKATYSAKIEDSFNDHVIMPGFINAHTHIGMNYFRGLGSDLALMDWLNNHMWPAEKKWLNHEFVYDASLFAMAEMIRSGTTCFNDMYFFLKATAEASEYAGMRAFIGMTVLEFPTNWAETTDQYFKRGLEFYEEYKNHPLITTTFAPHAPYTISDATFMRIKEIADSLSLKINLHLHETMDEINQSLATFNKRPIKRLDDLGFLSPNVISVHSVNINAEDLEILSRTKPQIVHCPESNMKLASGICPLLALKEAGLNVGLGTDSVASNNDLNMIAEMRQANFLAKISTQNSLSLNAAETLQLATLDGAKVLGIEHLVGSLEKNKAADFIAMDLNAIETLPIYDPLAQVVYSSGREQVTDVWVAGKQLMKNRTLLTIDEEAVKAKAKFWGGKIQS